MKAVEGREESRIGHYLSLRNVHNKKPHTYSDTGQINPYRRGAEKKIREDGERREMERRKQELREYHGEERK